MLHRLLLVMVCADYLLPPTSVEGTKGNCLAIVNSPFHTFGSKTAYELVRGKDGIADVLSCKPAQVWAFVRHGVHYAQPEDIRDFARLAELQKKVVNNHKEGKGQLCPEDLENLSNWEPLVDQTNKCYHLTEEGQRDLYNLGHRIRVYFKELFSKEMYSPDKFVFRSSPIPMNTESMEAFYKGLFALQLEEPMNAKLPEPDENDQLLYKYKNCPAWRDAMLNTENERAKFIKSEYMKNVIKNANERLGFDKHALKLSDVKAIYNVCRLNKAWDLENISPWCATFSTDDLEVLEYAEDLGFYYRTGKGHYMNLALACPLANDLFTRFSKVEEQTKSENPLGVFYFGHSTLMYMLDARLGLTDNPPITAENFPQMRKRHFRTSQVSPFSGNIIAVLYKCSSGERFRTMFYQAENKVNYPGCNKGLCDWKLIKQQFSPFIKEPVCLDTKWCNGNVETSNKKINPNTSVNPNLYYCLLFILLFLFFGLVVLRNFAYQ